jgi:hypothetical protein
LYNCGAFNFAYLLYAEVSPLRVQTDPKGYDFAVLLVMIVVFLCLWGILKEFMSLKQFIDKCENPNFADQKNLMVLKGVLNVICTYLEFENLCLVLSIVYFKSTKDILQGINKLDYLLKISVFQVYRRDSSEQ